MLRLTQGYAASKWNRKSQAAAAWLQNCSDLYSTQPKNWIKEPAHGDCIAMFRE